MAIIKDKNNSNKTRSGVNRVINQIITGFTTDDITRFSNRQTIRANYSAGYIANKNNKTTINSVIKNLLNQTSDYILSPIRNMLTAIKYRFLNPCPIKDTKELEESVSIRKPISGGTSSKKYLEYLKFIE